MSGSIEVIVKQAGRPDRVVPLREGTSRMGRADDSEIALSDVGVSRRHARIIVHRGSVRVEDMGSGNGTFVRGQKVDKLDLRDGDEVVIDPFVIQIRAVGRHLGDPTPQVPLRARLDVVTGPALAQASYPIPARGLTIGRSDTRDVVIKDAASSRHHCSIFLQQGVHVLRDMGSANGVHVNGQRVDECTLNDGDVVTIGNSELRYASGQAARQSTGRDRSVVSNTVSRTRSGDALSWVFVAATVLTVGLLAVIAALSVIFIRVDAAPHTTTVHSGPPTWSLTVDEPPTTTEPDALFSEGLSQIRAGDHRAALETFWLTLRARPGYRAGEVFAYAAGEHLIIDAMRPTLDAHATTRLARETERDRLISDNSRASRRTLERDYSEDLIVREALSLGPSRMHDELERQLSSAAELAASGRCVDALALYDEVLGAAQDDSFIQSARSGRTLCRRELARTVHASWAQGVRAQESGDIPAAKAAFQAVLSVDPTNPSARLRMDQLE